MDSAVTLQHCCRYLHLPVHNFSIPPSPFRSQLHIAPPPSSLKSITSSFASPPSSYDSIRLNPQIPDPIPSSILKTTSVTIAAVAALLLTRISGKPAIAAVNPTLIVDSEEELAVIEEEKEKELESKLANDPNDVKILGAHLSRRYYDKKFLEALVDVNRLIELEPNESKWLVWRGFVHNGIRDTESARNDFEKVLEQDPCRFRAYQGIAYSLFTDRKEANEIEAIQKRIERLLEDHKEEIGKSDVRRFKMLISDAKFMKGSCSEAIDDLKELERENPMDFSQNFLLGDFYTALGMNDEAKKHDDICIQLLSHNPNTSYLGVDDKKLLDGDECNN